MKYPEDFINKVINKDCMEVFSFIPNKSIDLVCCDPPYGVRQKKEKNTWDNKDNFLRNIDLWLNECLRVSKTVIWFCAGKMLPHILKNREKDFRRLLIWNKEPGSQFAGAMHSNIWYSIEPILVFGEQPKLNKKKRYGYACFNYRTIPEKEFNHPTIKPLGLIKDLVYFYSNEGDMVLDPFMGSGTTGVACKEMNRNFIGVEIDPKYCEISKKRINGTSATNITLF